jgi:arylsulfatase A-like enzyme
MNDMTVSMTGPDALPEPRRKAWGLSLRTGISVGLIVGAAEALGIVYLHLGLESFRSRAVHALWVTAATTQFFILGNLLLDLAYSRCLARATWHQPGRRPWAHGILLNLPLLGILFGLVPVNQALPEFNSIKSILGNLAFLVLDLGIYPAGMALWARRPTQPRPGRSRPKSGRTGWALGAVEALLLLGMLFAREEVPPEQTQAWSADHPPSSARPNLLLITLDAFRADRLTCSSEGRRLIPNLDRLARQSTCFEHAYTQGSHTSAAFPALFLSMYADELGQSPFIVIGDERTSLAELLRRHGYRTAAWVGNNPFLESRFGYGRGFESYSVALFNPFPALFERINFSRLGNLLFQTLYVVYVSHLYLTGSPGGTDRMVDQALAWLEPPNDRPFFLWIHLMNLHAPYGGRYLQNYIQSLDPDYQGRFQDFYAAQNRAENAGLTPREALHIRAMYDAGLIFLDERIGRLLQFLSQRGIYDRTLIIVTGDHGEVLGEHRHFQHDEMWEEVIRVPLLIKRPGQTEAQVLKENYRLLDLAPTVLDLLGLRPGAEMQGRSFQGPLLGGAEQGRPVFVTRTNPEADLAAVVIGRSKLIYRLDTGSSELFDLAADPGEVVDLSSREPGIRDQLLMILQAHLGEVDRVRRRLAGGKTVEPVDLNPTERNQLRALGYIQALAGPRGQL